MPDPRIAVYSLGAIAMRLIADRVAQPRHLLLAQPLRVQHVHGLTRPTTTTPVEVKLTAGAPLVLVCMPSTTYYRPVLH